jgi:hypothetical protein
MAYGVKKAFLNDSKFFASATTRHVESALLTTQAA